MRAYGHFNPGLIPAAYIEAVVFIKELGVRKTLEFLIDTGAAKTVIMEKDAEKSGIDYSLLPKSSIGLIGIGGRIETHEAKNAELHFVADGKQEHVEFLERLHIARYAKANAMQPAMPSMIGRDILNKYRLVYDKRNNAAYIEDR